MSRANVSMTLAPLSVHTSGRKPPVRFATPFTNPRGSRTGSGVVEKTTPEVPNANTASPSAMPSPRAEACWSPPPAETSTGSERPSSVMATAVVVPATPSGASTSGSIAAQSRVSSMSARWSIR